VELPSSARPNNPRALRERRRRREGVTEHPTTPVKVQQPKLQDDEASEADEQLLGCCVFG